MIPPRYFVDEPTLASLWMAWRWRRRERDRGDVTVIDSCPGGLRGRGVRLWARVLGLRLTEAQFFLGDLRDDLGENLFRSARRSSAQIAWRGATAIVSANPFLRDTNQRFGRETIRLTMIKRVWPAAERVAWVLGVARALTRESGGVARVVVKQPGHIPLSLFADALVATEVQGWGAARMRLYAVVVALDGWRRLWSRRPQAGPPSSTPGPTKAGSVLVLQEDSLGLDRSERQQPHWIHGGAAPPVVVWRSQGDVPAPDVRAALTASKVDILGQTDIDQAASVGANSALGCELTTRAREAFRIALSANTVHSLALSGVGKLALQARTAAGICRHHGISVFLCGENYLLDAAAVQLIAPEVGVTTVSYQYSNISFLSPAMMCTADLMLLFSPMYSRHWESDGIGPKGWGVLGYPYDSAFDIVRDRAAALRASLAARGAQFVLSYFDESVQTGKWGAVHERAHTEDIDRLADAVCTDPTLAVIIKTQFSRNSPGQLRAESARVSQARATGRFVELCRGSRRNQVFPAEAALASDVTIGHAIGGTAALESAAAGCRSVVINPHDWWGSWDDRLAGLSVVFGSMEETLLTVQALRTGVESAQRLGQWDAVLDEFVAIRDGRAAVRLRELVTGLAKGLSETEAMHNAGIVPVPRERVA